MNQTTGLSVSFIILNEIYVKFNYWGLKNTIRILFQLWNKPDFKIGAVCIRKNAQDSKI